jgi:multicomponent Na+:H+ antiporter subunit G
MTPIDAFSVLCISGGVFFFLAGAVALLRFPDTLTRLHALTKADNLGFGLIVLGLLPQSPDLASGLKLVVVWLLVQMAAGSASQLIAQFASKGGPPA